MNWNSASEFFAMGGYALYVWGSFGVCALVMLVEPWLVRKRGAHALHRLRREAAAQKLNKDSN